MKKKVLFFVCLIAAATSQAQVGINNSDPKASLHVTPQNTDGTTAEGIIAPNLTRAQLIEKDARYDRDQRGAIVYVSDLSGTITTKTALVTAIGYYFFDDTLWRPFSQPAAVTTANNGLNMNGTTTELGGALTKATTISGTTANTLTISAPSIISGALQISSGTPGSGKVLTSDATGNATWQNVTAAPYAGTMGGTDLSMTSSLRYLQSYIDVPSGRSQIFVGGFIAYASANGYATFSLSSSSTAHYGTGYSLVPGLAGFTFTTESSIGQFSFFTNNTSGGVLRLYLWGLISTAEPATATATWKVQSVSEPYIFVAY
ncbi:hypothetical protein CLV62_102173 [Dysgonomonas alginatilytica]|uniref:Fimbrillin-like protein n=1 Tax=Dysgonomonas alginatilytica TaxID=1605892 RepID=A0A2V3PV16_9BACT|nr:hypothetical protein [Dysgonomonas alginatilytica]PXV68141.1 hypothetical protein CLV62_102173 [Dysgonomonas alginatilytica]